MHFVVTKTDLHAGICEDLHVFESDHSSIKQPIDKMKKVNKQCLLDTPAQ